MSEKSEPDKGKKKFHFFVDGKQFETDHSSITAAEIKKIAGIDPTYQVFLEEEDDTPDKQLSDADSVSLEGKQKHFFAVPPATFG